MSIKHQLTKFYHNTQIKVMVKSDGATKNQKTKSTKDVNAVRLLEFDHKSYCRGRGRGVMMIR